VPFLSFPALVFALLFLDPTLCPALMPGGKTLILESKRPANFKNSLGWRSGRITELARPAQP